MSRIPIPDVVVLLPGITGSVLQKDGRDVWALSGLWVPSSRLAAPAEPSRVALYLPPPGPQAARNGLCWPQQQA